MKKIFFSVLALVFFCGSAFAAGIVIKPKVGHNISGNAYYNLESADDDDSPTGINLAGEFFYKMNDVFKIGEGIEYLLPREAFNSDDKFSFMAVYTTVEVSPLKPLRELYLKSNLGVNALFDYELNNPLISYSNQTGGLYFAIGAGYEFKFGLMLELMYSYYYGSMDVTTNFPRYMKGKFNLNYETWTLNVGYKFEFNF